MSTSPTGFALSFSSDSINDSLTPAYRLCDDVFVSTERGKLRTATTRRSMHREQARMGKAGAGAGGRGGGEHRGGGGGGGGGGGEHRARWTTMVTNSSLDISPLTSCVAPEPGSRAGQGRTGQDRKKQGKAGQGKERQGTAGQGRTGQCMNIHAPAPNRWRSRRLTPKRWPCLVHGSVQHLTCTGHVVSGHA